MDWSNMVEDVLDLILSKVSRKDKYTFSEVCHSWNKVMSASSYRSPCLMFTNRSSHALKLFQHQVFFSMDFTELDKNAVICCSKYGWLLMSRDDETLFFFDPFNSRRIEVPTWPKAYGFTTLSFFNRPTSSNCFIIGIMCGLMMPVKIGLLRHGDNEWNIDCMKHIETTEALQFQAPLAPPILRCGKLYFLDVKGKVATLNLSEDGLRKGSVNAESGYIFRKCLKQRRLRKNIKEHFLVKPMGEDAVFAVFLMNDDRKVRVFRLLEPDMRWESVDDLGDMVFYVSNASSFGYRTCNKSMKNKIFFPKFQDEKVVFYSLDTKMYHSFRCGYSSKECYAFKKYDNATWMMLAPTPHLRRESLTWCLQEQGSH